MLNTGMLENTLEAVTDYLFREEITECISTNLPLNSPFMRTVYEPNVANMLSNGMRKLTEK